MKTLAEQLKKIPPKKLVLPLVLFLFALVGSIAMLRTRASTINVRVESESGNVAGNIVTQSSNSTSGGRYVMFNGTTAGGPHSTTTGATNCNQNSSYTPTIPVNCRAIVSSGQTRYFNTYRPAATVGKKVPILIGLPSSGMSPVNYEGTTAMNNGIADVNAYVVAYLDGRHYNESRNPPGTSAGTATWFSGSESPTPRFVNANSTTDLVFIRDVINDLANNLGWGDSSRVYVVGRSAGGVMAYRVACQSANSIKAVVVISGTTPLITSCQPSRPVTIMEINSALDATSVGGTNTVGEITESSQVRMQRWSNLLGCSTSSTTTLNLARHVVSSQLYTKAGGAACNNATNARLIMYSNVTHNNEPPDEVNPIIASWLASH